MNQCITATNWYGVWIGMTSIHLSKKIYQPCTEETEIQMYDFYALSSVIEFL